MKRSINLLIIGVAAGLGLLAGFLWRNNSASTLDFTPAISTSGNSSNAFGASSQNRNAVRAHDDSPLTTRLDRDLSMSAGVTRWLYWLEAIEKAQPSDFPRLARLAQGNSSAMRLVGVRWAAIAPRSLFDYLTTTTRSERNAETLNELDTCSSRNGRRVIRKASSRH